MGQIYLVGVGLDGILGLPAMTRDLIGQSDLLVGSARLLSSCPAECSKGKRWALRELTESLERIERYCHTHLDRTVVILTTGDPLFFGFGRLVLSVFPPEDVTIVPTLSSVQLAFSRLKMPWQDATFVSVHGRGFDDLIQAVRTGKEKIAVLTDRIHSPAAIARLILSLDLPSCYQAWVCENLGGPDERVSECDLSVLQETAFDALTVVILIRQPQGEVGLTCLPIMGIPDSLFQSFHDRPGLMTKREIRLMALGELALHRDHICWDIGAGTGSMSIEIARLLTEGQVYAVEKSSAGHQLIRQNMRRFKVSNLTVAQGLAPDAMLGWPPPDRVFIGGSGQKLIEILQCCQTCLKSNGRVVLAIATLETFRQALTWFENQSWPMSILQIHLSRSVPVADLTRFQPLNPVYLMTADFGMRSKKSSEIESPPV